MGDNLLCISFYFMYLTLFVLLCLFPGLQPSSKSSSFPVRMDNSVPIVPQNQSAQSLQIQPSMLTQVRLCEACACVFTFSCVVV